MSELAKVWETATIVEVYTSDGAWEQAYYALLNGHYPALRALEQELKAEREATLSRVRQMEEALQHLADELTQIHGWMDNYERQVYISQRIAVAKDPSELVTTRRLEAGDSTHPAQGER